MLASHAAPRLLRATKLAHLGRLAGRLYRAEIARATKTARNQYCDSSASRWWSTPYQGCAQPPMRVSATDTACNPDGSSGARCWWTTLSQGYANQECAQSGLSATRTARNHDCATSAAYGWTTPSLLFLYTAANCLYGLLVQKIHIYIYLYKCLVYPLVAGAYTVHVVDTNL